jgi:hypothetical protein
MTEDEAFNELERVLKAQQRLKDHKQLNRANVAAAEFIATQTVEMLAITTLRKAFACGYEAGWHDAKEDK